ncbi:MAG: TonB-dependent receptor plug domain-containing protein, partial [Sphingomonadales bacterium]|nr:TonB-dependent receptor plug domain-containing protein [Sphingomonadales bacterium]
MKTEFGSLARGAGLSAIAFVLCTFASAAYAAETAEGADAPATGIAEGSDIVVTATRANEIAPATSSLEARQPQAIVSRSLIEDSLPATADFNQIALITPSVSNFGGNNGIGLGESKAQIRGFQDAEYNITYDGVPFGDTNDPSHHSTTFFPSNTIETIVVDRGPGNASQLGQATFGGNINLFSRAVRDDFGGQLKASYGSFDTYLLRGLL